MWNTSIMGNHGARVCVCVCVCVCGGGGGGGGGGGVYIPLFYIDVITYPCPKLDAILV